MSIARALSLCTKKSNNNNRGFSGFLKAGGGGNIPKFSLRKAPFLAYVHAQHGPVGGVCLALASLQAIQIASLPSAFLVRVFSMSCRRARFLKLRRAR
jgi:hypothetical protein